MIILDPPTEFHLLLMTDFLWLFLILQLNFACFLWQTSY